MALRITDIITMLNTLTVINTAAVSLPHDISLNTYNVIPSICSLWGKHYLQDASLMYTIFYVNLLHDLYMIQSNY